jgi:putative flavoprotein involved in K+ transport
LVVGGGQAGLALSHMLSQRGCQHLVLERGRIAERWRTERWDGLRFQFPNWSVQLPDFPFPHADPDAFATSAEIVDFLNAYADFIAAPIRCGVTVTALRRREGASGFVAETSNGAIEAANVVVATGPYQRPIIPALLPEDASLFQVHASRYREPDQLPPGAVLIVGSGASGAQIAEELVRAGRHVYLSVGHHRRLPRRYRGRDLIWWLSALGLDQTPVENRGPDKSLPLITGAYGGHTIDFRHFATQGMTLLGRVEAAREAHWPWRPIWPTAWHSGMPPTQPSSTGPMHTSRGMASTCRKSPVPARCHRIRPVLWNRSGVLNFTPRALAL